MIVILAPYGRNEVTSAAIRLADLAMALGRDVRLVACGVHEKTVHPSWDDKVKSGLREGIYKACLKARHVVHFESNPAWYEKASFVSVTKGQDAKHILVPNWHGMGPKDRFLVTKYDQIVCPSRLCKRVLHAEVFQGDKSIDKDKLTWAMWDAGIPAVRREGTVENERIKACVYCDSSAIDFCGPMVVQMCGELLLAHPKLDLTVLASKSWSRHDRRDLKTAQVKWAKRLNVSRVSGLCDLAMEFHKHDWVVLPGVRSDFGLAAAKALACGAAVICHDVEPFSEVVSKERGLLVPCEIRNGQGRAPMAVPSMGDWLETCAKAFTDTKLLFKLQTRDWQLSEQQAAFNLAWSTVWT